MATTGHDHYFAHCLQVNIINVFLLTLWICLPLIITKNWAHVAKVIFKPEG